MQTNAIPEIEASDLKAAREFLTSMRDEERTSHAARIPLDARGAVTMRNGIARARRRSGAKTPS